MLGTPGGPVDGHRRHLRHRRASPTTCARGRPATAPPSCSAAQSRFILSTSGHIASLVNPPGNPKSTFQVAGVDPGRPAGVAGRRRRRVKGSWWPDFTDLARRAVRRARSRRRPTLGGGAARCWPRRPAPMSSTSSRPPSRGAVRPHGHARPAARCGWRSGPGRTTSVPPLLLMNGIGASLEVLQPFVDALDPRRTVIRFDVPGVGGSPRPVVPYNLATFSPVVAGVLDRLGLRRPVDVLGLSWGGGLAQHFAVQHRRRVPPAGAGRDRHRHADGAGPPPGAGPDAHPAPAPRPGLRAADRRRDLRRHDAHRSRARAPGRCTRPPGSGRGAATTTSWRRAPAGAACRSCG